MPTLLAVSITIVANSNTIGYEQGALSEPICLLVVTQMKDVQEKLLFTHSNH